MTQLYNISLGGTDVTGRQSSCTVSEEMNRIYNTATIVLDNSATIKLEDEVIINYGSRTFTGFVFKTSKTGLDQTRVECRTYSAQLTEPYSPSENVIDDATTSHELCTLYTTDTGITITNTSEDLDFGGSYERSGTRLSALLNIASVTGAEFYDYSGTVKIAPNKPITVDGTAIPPEDIFDFIPSATSVYNKGVGYVTIQNGGDTSTDVISLNNIYSEIDECSGEIFLYPNPRGALEHTVGIGELREMVIDRKEDYSVLDEDIVRLNGAIESITSITLNGINISNYNFTQEHNVLYFTTKMRGTLTVNYSAYAYQGYTSISVTPIGRFISLDAYYLDQALLFQGFLSNDCNNVATDGDMTCIVPSDLYYNKGFTVWTIGGDPEITFYDHSDPIERDVTSTSDDYVSLESATLEKTDTGYRYRTRYPLDTALGARSTTDDISYTTSVDGDDYYFEFTRYYPEVTVSYETAATSHYVQFPAMSDAYITMVIRNKNTDETCEYVLGTEIECKLNQYYPIDVASELGLTVNEVKGTSITYTRPTTTPSSVTVDSFGFVKIWVSANGDYVLDTSSLKSRSSITLTVNT